MKSDGTTYFGTNGSFVVTVDVIDQAAGSVYN
jgi:hypothetical protein